MAGSRMRMPAMFRYKADIGSNILTQTLPAQQTQAKVAGSMLNRMTRPGLPAFQRTH